MSTQTVDLARRPPRCCLGDVAGTDPLAGDGPVFRDSKQNFMSQLADYRR